MIQPLFPVLRIIITGITETKSNKADRVSLIYAPSYINFPLFVFPREQNRSQTLYTFFKKLYNVFGCYNELKTLPYQAVRQHVTCFSKINPWPI